MTTRQGKWSQDEDLLLAKVVLKYIREGGTQLQAFEEVGQQLSRTSGACGFRWNSFLRMQYSHGIELAKKNRNEIKEQRTFIRTEEYKGEIRPGDGYEHYINDNVKKVPITFQSIIQYLEEIYNKAQTSSRIEDKEKIKKLEKKTSFLVTENKKLTKNLKALEDEYRSLLEIMERARKMVILQDKAR